MNHLSDSHTLRTRLRRTGLGKPIIDAAWPTWWTDAAEASVSAQTELRFSLARKLGLDPGSLLEETDEPRFLWRDTARFKNLSIEDASERAALASFGTVLATLLIKAAPDHCPLTNPTPSHIRHLLLASHGRYVRLVDILAFCWSVGIPVVQLRVFPLTRKRMAAMAVSVGGRTAILLARDSEYPPQSIFFLAHEIAHVALQHIGTDSVLVDFNRDPLPSRDDEENQADAFALEMLTGQQRPTILPSQDRYTARELARVALDVAPDLRIEPGTLALCFGYSTADWPTAQAAMRWIYDSPKPVWKEVNRLAMNQLVSDRISDDSATFLAAVLGNPELS